MTLSANRNVDRYIDQELRSFPVAAGVHMYRGAFVGIDDNGYARPLVAGDLFAGIAYEEMDNLLGSSGVVQVRVFTQGDFEHEITGAIQSDIGRTVYASSDDTLSFASDGNSHIGYVQGLTTAGKIVLRLVTGTTGQQTISHLANNTTLRLSQANAIHTNRNATGTVTAILPQSAPMGTTFRFVCMADQALRIAPGSGSAIYIKGAKQADDKYVSINDIGDFIHLVADGSNDWVAVASISGADADITIES